MPSRRSKAKRAPTRRGFDVVRMARSFDEADRLDAEDSLLELRAIVSELVSEVRALAAEVRQRLPPSKRAPQPVSRNRVPPPVAFERVERIKKRKARK